VSEQAALRKPLVDRLRGLGHSPAVAPSKLNPQGVPVTHPSRRTAVLAGLSAGAALRSAQAQLGTAQRSWMPLTRPALPFAPGALAPHISEEAVRLHFGAHHIGYYNRLTSLLTAATPAIAVEDIVRSTHGQPPLAEIYTAAGQLFNHNFYWSSLRPAGGRPATTGRDQGAGT
jgi:hypothetical protein